MKAAGEPGANVQEPHRQPILRPKGIESDFNLPTLLEQFGLGLVPLAEQISVSIGIQ